MPPSCRAVRCSSHPPRRELTDLVIVGRVRRAHGVRGALAVESLIDTPDAVFASGGVIHAGDRKGAPSADGALHIIDGRPMNKEWLVQVSEIDDRDVADTWRGRYLLAERALLPAGDGLMSYLVSLVGMAVEVSGQGPVGTINDVYDAPQGPLVEVRTDHGSPLVPWRDEFVKEVDETRRTVVLYPLEGLLDS